MTRPLRTPQIEVTFLGITDELALRNAVSLLSLVEEAYDAVALSTLPDYESRRARASIPLQLRHRITPRLNPEHELTLARMNYGSPLALWFWASNPEVVEMLITTVEFLSEHLFDAALGAAAGDFFSRKIRPRLSDRSGEARHDEQASDPSPDRHPGTAPRTEAGPPNEAGDDHSDEYPMVAAPRLSADEYVEATFDDLIAQRAKVFRGFSKSHGGTIGPIEINIPAELWPPEYGSNAEVGLPEVIIRRQR